MVTVGAMRDRAMNGVGRNGGGEVMSVVVMA